MLTTVAPGLLNLDYEHQMVRYHASFLHPYLRDIVRSVLDCNGPADARALLSIYYNAPSLPELWRRWQREESALNGY